MNWLLEGGTTQKENGGGLRTDRVSHDGIDYIFEEQQDGDFRELRVKQGREVVAATAYVDGEIPENWDENYPRGWNPGYQANDIDWFTMDSEFEDCEDALGVYRAMKDL